MRFYIQEAERGPETMPREAGRNKQRQLNCVSRVKPCEQSAWSRDRKRGAYRRPGCQVTSETRPHAAPNSTQASGVCAVQLPSTLFTESLTLNAVLFAILKQNTLL